MGHVFDAARGIASVFQQRAAHCTLCWFDSSDPADSSDFCDFCKDKQQAICGRVERSKQFEISDSLGFVFTAQLFVLLSFSFACSNEGRNQYLLIWLPCLCCFLRCSLFRHLDFLTCFTSCPDH